MKSKWLKKAMAAFLAVLMTVCALPVAAFVPETVETGEEFAVETQDFFANGKTSIEMNGVIYFINNDDEDKLYKYSQSSPIHELVLDKHITTLVESDIANNEIYLVEYIDGKTQLLKMNTLSNETEEVVHFQGVVTNICIRNNTIFFVDNNRILYYDNNQCKTLVDLDNVATVFFKTSNQLRIYTNNGYAYTYNINTKEIESDDNTATLSAVSFSPRFTAPETTNPYYTTKNVFHTSGYGMVGNNGNCTCYAFGRAYEVLGTEPMLSHGNAGGWYSHNKTGGYYPYSADIKQPAPGAIVVWTQTNEPGHVAFIEVVDGNTVITSESGWNNFYFKTVTRNVNAANLSNAYQTFCGYIYVCGRDATSTLPDPTATTTSSSTGHKYAVYNYATTWENAKAKCEELGGYLATITSDSEQSLVLSLVQNLNKPCWIGAYRDSGSSAYKWITGESFSYTNWDDDEPSMSNGGRDERFVGIYANDTDTQYSTTGKWNDFSETTGTIKGFVCEWNPQTYTVSYNANGGTGAPGNQTKIHGVSLTLSSVKPSKDGYTFQGWSTSSTGGVEYNSGSSYTGNANLTLYAVWKSAHTHNYQALPEIQHPHRVWYYCSCGSSYYPIENGQYVTQKLSTCSICYPVTGVSLNKTAITLEMGKSFTLTATVVPSNAANKEVTWSSSNTSVAKVYSDGEVEARSGGTAVITVTSSDGSLTATCTVTVEAVAKPAGNLSWEAVDGTLYIHGTGDMENYSSQVPAPWENITYTKVIIDNGVTSIGSSAFRELRLTSVTIPSSVTSIGSDAFRESGLTSVAIPSSVTNIGDSAFYKCNNLTSVTIPSSVVNIGRYAFYECQRLTSVTMADGVKSLGFCAFWRCFSLANIRIPRSITNIDGGAFHGTTWYDNQPDGLMYINDILYSYKGTLPDNSHISIKSGTTGIAGYALQECSSGLKSIDIPTSVTSIGWYAFSQNTNLTDVYYAGSRSEFEQIYIGGLNTYLGSATLHTIEPVTSITLNQTSASLKKGETLTLTATITPSDAANKSVTWSSSNNSVATVTTSGVVTAVGEGTAVITVKTADGGKTATCTVAVAHTHNYTGTYYETAHPHKAYSKCSCGEINYTGATQKVASCTSCYPVTGVTLDKTTASLKKGETLTLTATVAPSDAANKSVTWSSGNTSVATVSTSGVVTAVGEGTAVITVTTADGGKTATCTVAVAHTHNYTGTYYETAHPHKAYSTCSCGEIHYTGATQKVASCASCYPVTGVTLDKTTATLKKGETLALAVTVSPSDAANKAFTVTSSNPSVMSAEYRISVCVGDLFDGSTCTASHCEFTALSAGSTTLTFTTEDGQKTATCTVTVTEPVVNAKAKFTLSEASGRPGDTVKITLSLKTEETINSIAISGITYDTSIMTFTGFSDYEHIEDLTILPPTFDEEKMAIVIGLKNAAAFDGDICTLNFKINENALEGVTNIDASSVVKLKSVEIPSAVASGKVNVRLQTLGDIDGNDTVDIDDAVLLFQYSMLPELYPISYAGNLDFNKDGTVDIDDAVRLFQYSMLPDLYPLE